MTRIVKDSAGRLLKMPNPGEERCDFDNKPAPTWVYPALEFSMVASNTDELRSIGEWAACGACSAFIEAGDYPGLIARVLRIWRQRHPDMMPAPAKNHLTALYVRFDKARIGPRRAL